MASFSCHVVGVAKQVRLERIVRWCKPGAVNTYAADQRHRPHAREYQPPRPAVGSGTRVVGKANCYCERRGRLSDELSMQPNHKRPLFFASGPSYAESERCAEAGQAQCQELNGDDLSVAPPNT